VSSPGDHEPAWPDDAVEIGRIVDAWGIKGWIKVQPFASDPQALFSSKRWFLQPPERGPAPRTAASPGLPHCLKVVQAKDHADVVVAQVQDVADRSEAEALRGARVFISRASFPTPDKDEFYWVDLIGLSVVNREGQALGDVIGLYDTGPQSVLRIVDPALKDAPERLIPFVNAFVIDVSLEQRRIMVDWGLDY
jgi:16S rRNA processing protein RimM